MATYTVRYYLLDANADGVIAHRRTKVDLIDGYTTRNDIPRILATAHAVTPNRIEIKEISDAR